MVPTPTMSPTPWFLLLLWAQPHGSYSYYEPMDPTPTESPTLWFLLLLWAHSCSSYTGEESGPVFPASALSVVPALPIHLHSLVLPMHPARCPLLPYLMDPIVSHGLLRPAFDPTVFFGLYITDKNQRKTTSWHKSSQIFGWRFPRGFILNNWTRVNIYIYIYASPAREGEDVGSSHRKPCTQQKRAPSIPDSAHDLQPCPLSPQSFRWKLIAVLSPFSHGSICISARELVDCLCPRACPSLALGAGPRKGLLGVGSERAARAERSSGERVARAGPVPGL